MTRSYDGLVFAGNWTSSVFFKVEAPQ